MNLQSLFAAFVAIIFKYVNKQGVSFIEFMLFRNVFNFFTNLGVLKLYNYNPLKDTNGQLDWVIYRGLTGQLCFFLFLISVSLLPLSLHMIIYQTSPFWTSILAYWLNGEKVQMVEYFAMALCFTGVVAIALSK